MYTFLTVVFMLVCLFLIAVVLLQQGKGSDIGDWTGRADALASIAAARAAHPG